MQAADSSLPPLTGEAVASEGELLVGQELQAFLLQQQESRIEKLKQKLTEYMELDQILKALLEKPRHTALAPVAGGLGYFKASLNETNRLLVLLGDGWFAEKSVGEAREIVDRRRKFLQQQLESAEAEYRTLLERGALLEEEELTVQPAASREEAKKTPSAKEEEDGSAAPSFAFNGITPEELRWFSRWSGKSVEALTTITVEDELTEEELMLLEEKLSALPPVHDDVAPIDDDAFVEQALTDAVMEKKERKLLELIKAARAEEALQAEAKPRIDTVAAPEHREEASAAIGPTKATIHVDDIQEHPIGAIQTGPISKDEKPAQKTKKKSLFRAELEDD